VVDRSGRNARREEPLLEAPESGHGSEIMEHISSQGPDNNRGSNRDGHEVIEVQILPQVSFYSCVSHT